MTVITGVGLITALGNDTNTTWEKLCSGKVGISDVPYWNKVLYKSQIAGVIKGYNPKDFFSKKKLARLEYSHQLAITAALMAIEDAALDERLDRKKVGIFIGTSLAGMISGQNYHKQVLHNQKPDYNLILNYPMQALLDKLTQELKYFGPRSIVSTACTASTIAIAQAVESIKLGRINCALVGGVDPLCEFSFAGFDSMQNMSIEPCAPFSFPTGLNLGEGAGMLIIESFSHAHARNARIYAEVGGYALSADAYHPTSPDASGIGQKNLMTQLLINSQESPDDIDYINAHGTATGGNDVIEAKGIKIALGNKSKTYVSSSKGAIGHTLGAAGAIEAIITTLAVYNDVIPPTANFKEVRPNCDLNHVKGKAISKPVQIAVTQNFAFGGNNAALLIRKPKIRHFEKPKNSTRCVITGMGVISPVGIGKDAFSISLKNKEIGISSLNDNSDEYLGGFIKNFNPSNVSRANFRRSDRISSFTICASEMAFQDAQLTSDVKIKDNNGIVFGTDCGPLETTRLFHEPIAVRDMGKLNPMLFPNTVLNAGTGLTSIHLKLKGPNVVINVGEASGLKAITYGYDLVKSSISERMIVGGVDELSQFKINAFNFIKKSVFKYVTPDIEGKKRAYLGEGGVAFVLESMDTAVDRKANIIAEILGYSNTANSSNKNIDQEEGIKRSMYEAIEDSGIELECIDLICSGSFSSSYNLSEKKAIEALFQKKMPIYNPSKYFGISAATAPMGLAAVLLAISGKFPISSLLEDEDAKLLNNFDVCLINSISMGNNNVSLVVKRVSPKK